MAKQTFILAALMVLQGCTKAAPNANTPNVDAVDNSYTKQALLKPKSELYGITEAANDDEDKNTPGQRQKRFNNYFSVGFSPFASSSYSPNFVKRDDSQETGNFGAEATLSIISRKVMNVLNYTRQRVFNPPPIPFTVPSFLPVFYVPHSYCDCASNNYGNPINDEEPGSDVPSTPPTTTTTTTTTPRTAPINNPQTNPPAADVSSTTPNDVSTFTPPDFSSRLQNINTNSYDNDYEDGARPISFNPILPNKPMSRPPPPVDHGIKQSGGNVAVGTNKFGSTIVPSTIPPLVITGLPAQQHLPTNAIPTLCDGAALSCCHRKEVTYDCFLQHGCPDPMPAHKPCDDNILLEIVRKFQFYYANRRG